MIFAILLLTAAICVMAIFLRELAKQTDLLQQIVLGDQRLLREIDRRLQEALDKLQKKETWQSQPVRAVPRLTADFEAFQEEALQDFQEK